MMIQHFLISFVLIYSLGMYSRFAPAHLAQETSDEGQIRQMLNDYIVGWREADGERLARVFAAKEGRVMWISKQSGKEILSSMTFGEILQRENKPQPHYGLDWEVLDLDIVDGRLAVAKLHISRAGGSYIDFLVCHKIAGEWRIVNKTFVVR